MPERKVSYEKIARKKETGLKLEAPSLQRLYIDAGLAFTDFLIPLDLIQVVDKKTVCISGTTQEDLLAKWINHLLHLFKKEKFLSSRIVYEKFDGKSIQASLFGESYVPTRHGSSAEITTEVSSKEIAITQKQGQDTLFLLEFYWP